MSAWGWDQAQRIAAEYGTKFSPNPEPDDGSYCALIAIRIDHAADLIVQLEACGCRAYLRESKLNPSGAFVFLQEY